jgi:hypothetical protein
MRADDTAYLIAAASRRHELARASLPTIKGKLPFDNNRPC